jgi:predicted anti-sigma-YlaC factor YlaD
MLSCKEVVAHSEALLEGEASLLKRIQIRMHLRVCEHCTRYIRQLSLMLRAFRRLHPRTGDDRVGEIMDAVHRG